MEDAEDSIVDIDCGDLKDTLAVVEYIDDIYAYYKKSEVIQSALGIHSLNLFAAFVHWDYLVSLNVE